MQDTPGDEFFDLDPFFAPCHDTAGGSSGIDLVNVDAEYGMSVSIDLSDPAVPQTLVWPDGGTSMIVSIERINLHIAIDHASSAVHVMGGADSDTLNGGKDKATIFVRDENDDLGPAERVRLNGVSAAERSARDLVQG